MRQPIIVASAARPSLFSSLVLTTIIILILGGVYLIWYHDKGTMDVQMVLFTALSGVANMLVVVVAYWQLPAMDETNRAAHETTRGTFLLMLTEKWMHEDLIQARCLLHQQALKATIKDHIPDIISAYVTELSQNSDPTAVRQFSNILSLLEFMEILAGLHKDKHIELPVMQRLFGGSIERYFYYLQGYIAFRRKNGSPPGVTFKSDKSLYKNYENLVDELVFYDRSFQRTRDTHHHFF